MIIKASGITAIVTAFRRVRQTLLTLQRIQDCQPSPDEILVHVDVGGAECKAAIERNVPDLPIITSDARVGPGGGRNKLIAAARNEIIASFDDDSYPIDRDYFARLHEVCAKNPNAAVVASEVFIRNQEICAATDQLAQVASFMGGACAYRRAAFMQVPGHVPLEIAYGMEEVDLALQFYAAGKHIVKSAQLRVFHDTDYSGHRSPNTVAGTIANAALLMFLRYPLSAWPWGILQISNVFLYAARQGRWQGILSGLLRIPGHLCKYRHYRRVVPADALRSFLALRRNPRVIAPSGEIGRSVGSCAPLGAPASCRRLSACGHLAGRMPALPGNTKLLLRNGEEDSH